MRTTITALAFIGLIGTSAVSAQDSALHEELVEWVFEPCMEVAAALDVESMDRESVDLGIKREHIAELMLASRDAAIQDLARTMKAGETWEERRAAYPVMLRVCISQQRGM